VGRLRPVPSAPGQVRGHRQGLPQSYERFWRWAMTQDLADPGDITTTIVNEWVDHECTRVAPTTVAIVWRNLRPFFSWWAREIDQPNPFVGADVPGARSEPPAVLHLDDIRNLLQTRAKDFAGRRDEAVIRVLFDTAREGARPRAEQVHRTRHRRRLAHPRGDARELREAGCRAQTQG
jgi:site-specific recombinase XerD